MVFLPYPTIYLNMIYFGMLDDGDGGGGGGDDDVPGCMPSGLGNLNYNSGLSLVRSAK